MEIIFSETCRHVISFFLKPEKGHIGVISHNHNIMGTKEQVQGRWGRSMEENGGDLGGGEGEERVGAICFYFPQPLAFFGFSPHNFLIGKPASMATIFIWA